MEGTHGHAVRGAALCSTYHFYTPGLDARASVSRTVAKLLIRNMESSELYTTKAFSISMSIDSATDNFGPEVNGTLQVQDTSLQEVYVCLTGRYLKFKVLTYGHNSAGLKYVAVY